MNVSQTSCNARFDRAHDLAVRGVLVCGSVEDEVWKNLKRLGFDV